MLSRIDSGTPPSKQAQPERPKRPRQRKRSFDINHQRRRDIARLVKHRYGSLAKTPAELRTKYIIAAAWHCPDDSERRYLMVKWHREAGTPALPSTMHRIDAILEANPARRMKADTLARRLHVSDAERTRLHIWTIGAYDVPRAMRIERRKENRRLAAKARREANGGSPREQSVSRTKPWEAEGVSRATWYRRQAGETNTRPRVSSLIPCHEFVSPSANGHDLARSPVLAGLKPCRRRDSRAIQGDEITDNLISTIMSSPSQGWRAKAVGYERSAR
jgi:hypothetical protein